MPLECRRRALPAPLFLCCSDREKFLGLSGLSLVVVFFLTSVGATLFYALGLSMLVIGAHAALRVPGSKGGRAQRRRRHRAAAGVNVWCTAPHPHVRAETLPPFTPLPADDLFLDEVPDAQQGGFLSLLGVGGAKSSTAVAATALASAV